MLNLNELESRWLKYKIKSYIPHVIIFFSIIIIAIAVTSIEFSQQNKVPSTIEKEVITLPIESKAAPKIIQEREVNIPPIITKKEKVAPNNTKQVIQPSLNFMNSMKRSSPEYYQDDMPVVSSYEEKEKVIQQQTQVIQKPLKKIKQEIVVEEDFEVEIPKTSNISIQRQNTYEDIQHVIKRFKKSNNPALSLFVAKKYYELTNYKQAYNYSLITNELNSDIEESWIIFAKSLVKLGKKDKALIMLRKYINNSHSQRAQLLLDNIKSGKIK